MRGKRSPADGRLLFFLEEKKQKKIICGTGILCAFAAFANVLHKTDGSNANRPFLYSKQNVRESIFSQINHLSRNVFCFFSSRKENVPRNRPPKSSTALVALQQAGNGEPAFFSAVTHGAADALDDPNGNML